MSAGDAPAQASDRGRLGDVMPPFGKNVHIDMTTWLPANASLAQAVLTDKDYELAYLYAEYTGGQDRLGELRQLDHADRGPERAVGGRT